MLKLATTANISLAMLSGLTLYLAHGILDLYSTPI